MKIELKEIPIREIVAGYVDNDEDGVFGYGGRLNIRPPYQREFIYNDEKRNAVINTIKNDFPLNVMYWSVREDGDYEIIDGQQRTISVCQYYMGEFSYKGRYYHNLQEDEKQKFLDYKLMIYFCSGTDSERLEWFKIINIAGEELRPQELRNAVYAGAWTTDAKRYFSKRNCPAYGLGSDYLSGTAIRQDYLETVIRWISKDNIEAYMAENQHKTSANELFRYFTNIITWIQAVFPNYRNEMKGVNWGPLYDEFKDKDLDPKELEVEISALMLDDDVNNKKGIYPYVLTRQEKHLNIRAFTLAMKRAAYERQEGICVVCKEHFEIDEMEADHITPWHEGGRTIPENCQMLCKEDNRRKSGK